MLNRKAYEHAMSLIRQGKVDRTSGWSFSADDGNRILGDPPDWEEYGRWFLLKDPDADPETKEAWKYPYGKGGKVYRSALIAIRQRAAQQNEREIFEAAGRLLALVDKEKQMAEPIGETDWIEVFRAGRYPQGEFTEEHLREIAETYDPSWHEAPVVVGHPRTDDPAYGWVSAVKAEGGRLLVKLRQVVPEFADAVRRGLYKKVSVALSRVIGKGRWYLKHVGFLGAAAPQVKGLAPVTFVADEGDVVLEVSFGKEDEMDVERLRKDLEKAQARLQELEAKEATFAEKEKELEAARRKAAEMERKLRLQEIRHKVDGMVKDGKLAPCFVEMGIADFWLALDGAPEVEFTDEEGKVKEKKSPARWFEEFLGKLPHVVDFREIAKDGKPRPGQEDEDVKLGLRIAGKAKQDK